MGDVGSKTRSLGQILEKPCVRSRGHIFSPIIMKLGQNVCLNNILDKFQRFHHVSSITRSLGQILKKPCVHPRGHIFSLIIMKHSLFVLMKSHTGSKMGLVGSKTRLLCKILEKLCVRSRSQIFSQIIIKLGQKVCLNEISDEYENGSCQIKN